MHANFLSGLKMVFKSVSAIGALTAMSFAFGVSSAQATVIDFDDLEYIPGVPDDCFCDHELTNEYSDKGVIINGGFLSTRGAGDNYLLASNWLELSFVGPLPTSINLTVSASHEDVVYLSANGPSGFASFKQTLGWAGPFDDTPYVPNQLVSFSSASGISSIIITAFYDLRADAIIDGIHCDYTNVPEPSSLGLLSLGLLAGFRLRSRRLRSI